MLASRAQEVLLGHAIELTPVTKVELTLLLLALLWKPLSLQLYPLPLVGSQTYKMYKCNLVDFIKIILILKYKQTTTTTTKHTKVLQFLC